MHRPLLPFSCVALLSSTVLLAGSVVGCAAAPGDEPGSAIAPIVNGTLGGIDSVVVLQNYESGGLCTGALIAERVVLTAKHCIQEAFAEGPVRPGSMVVGVGDDIRNVTHVLRVQSIYTTPGTYTEDSRGGVNSTLVGSDVAVIVLQSGVSSIEPLPIMRTTHTVLGGQTITAVGYGQIPRGGAGVKYTTTGRVQGTDRNLIYVGAITCQGDSGGPAITETGEVAGVVSFGAGSCGTGYGAYNAIFPYLELIDRALTEAGSCLNDGEERCDGADNDCDDAVDETCNAIGDPCAADAECVGQTCRDTDAGRICTVPCDPLRPSFGCDPGLYCAPTEGCSGFCVPLGGGAQDLPLGVDCTGHAQCASLFCDDPGDGLRRCLSPCRGDSGMCLAGEACAASPGACGGCVDAEILVEQRGLGEECTDLDQCRSGNCFEDAGRAYCTRACEADSECPTGFHCRDAVCVAGPRGAIGEPCVGNGDCVDGAFCATRGAQSWCTRVCTSEECPEGFACVPAGGTDVCAPELGLVGDPCATDGECVTGLCALREGEGACTRVCSADSACAPGFECRRTDDGASAVCVAPMAPPVSGGCSVAPRRGLRVVGLGFGALLLGIALRRRLRR